MWHDCCLMPEIRSPFETVKGVTKGIESMLPGLQAQLKKLCWINPSWVLLAIKNSINQSGFSLFRVPQLLRRQQLPASLRSAIAIFRSRFGGATFNGDLMSESHQYRCAQRMLRR